MRLFIIDSIITKKNKFIILKLSLVKNLTLKRLEKIKVSVQYYEVIYSLLYSLNKQVQPLRKTSNKSTSRQEVFFGTSIFCLF